MNRLPATRRRAWAALAALLTVAGGIVASAAEPPATSPILIEQLRAANVQIVGGRIRSVALRQGQRLSSSQRGRGRNETLIIDLTGDAPAVRYDLVTVDEQFSFELSGGDQVTILRRPASKRSIVPVHFFQPPHGALELRVGDGEQSPAVSGSSLWHVLLADPDLCNEHLTPLLELIQSNWHLADESELIEEEMSRLAAGRAHPDRAQWNEWLVELGSPRYTTRRAAERSLVAAGRSTLPFFENLDRSALDAEQRSSVRRILASLRTTASLDTPTSVAERLVDDETIWLALVDRTDGEERRFAISQIERLLGRHVPLDPDADAETLHQQVGELREKLRQRANGESAAERDETENPPPSQGGARGDERPGLSEVEGSRTRGG